MAEAETRGNRDSSITPALRRGRWHIELETPYGNPSAPRESRRDRWGKSVAFPPEARGAEEEILPHKIPYRANVWALKEIGVRRIVVRARSSAAYSPRPLSSPCERSSCATSAVDRTWGRGDTFYDGLGTTLVISAAAEPFCADLSPHPRGDRPRIIGIPGPLRGGAQAVVIQGPRFVTLAESRWFQQMGRDTVNMDLIAHPECYLARELDVVTRTSPS